MGKNGEISFLREVQMNGGVLVWITGLAGSGKSTIAKQAYARIRKDHPNTVLLDGDTFRQIMGVEDGHDPAERRRIAMQLSRLCQALVTQNINVVCATISLFEEVHTYNRKHCARYLEVFVDCGREELERRDQKALYSRALQGRLKNVMGVDLKYDRPRSPDVHLQNSKAEQLPSNIDQVVLKFEEVANATV